MCTLEHSSTLFTSQILALSTQDDKNNSSDDAIEHMQGNLFFLTNSARGTSCHFSQRAAESDGTSHDDQPLTCSKQLNGSTDLGHTVKAHDPSSRKDFAHQMTKTDDALNGEIVSSQANFIL